MHLQGVSLETTGRKSLSYMGKDPESGFTSVTLLSAEGGLKCVPSRFPTQRGTVQLSSRKFIRFDSGLSNGIKPEIHLGGYASLPTFSAEIHRYMIPTIMTMFQLSLKWDLNSYEDCKCSSRHPQNDRKNRSPCPISQCIPQRKY